MKTYPSHILQHKRPFFGLNPLVLLIEIFISEKDIYCVAQLYIMQHECSSPILTENEVKSFILVNLRMKTLTDEDIMDIPISFVPTIRSVQLATFYWRNLLDMFSDCVGDILAK